MTELSDEDVFGKPRELSDAEVFGRPEAPTWGNVSESIPEAFLDRVRAGQALSRILSAAGHEAKEGMTGQTPTGYSDDRLAHMIDIGVFHDPLKSRAGPIQMMSETVLFPVAQAWQGVTTALNAGIHGAGGAVGQLVEEFGGSQGNANRAKNEIINAGNWAMIEGGMGRFSRPAVEPHGVADQAVGGLPRPEDFANAAKVLDPERSASVEVKRARPTAPPDSEFARMSVADLERKAEQAGGPEAAAPGFEDFIYDHLNPDQVASIRAQPDAAKIETLKGAIKEASENGVYVQPLPDDIRVSIWTGEKWIPGGSVTDNTNASLAQARAVDTIAAALYDAKGNRTIPLDQFNSMFARAWRGIGEVPAEANLRRMWQEDGITPAEAVHDAQGDAFLKNEIAARQVEVPLSDIRVEGDHSEFVALDRALSAARKDRADIKERWQDARDKDQSSPEYRALDTELDLADARVREAEKAANEWKRPGERQTILTPEETEIFTETGGRPPASLGAAATEPGDIPLSVQPASAPGSLAASFKSAADALFDIGRDAQMLVAPMARGTRDSMAIAKDFANALRRNRWDWSRIDTDIAKRFTPEQRARMWNAADEESVSLQLGEAPHLREHQGLATLEPAERAAVEDLHSRAQNAWMRAGDVGLVEGEGLPAYTPRMVINTAGSSSKEAALALNSIGKNLKTKTANMLKRKYLEAQETEAAAKAKYGDEAMLARDIRVLPLATAHLEDAIAGRALINNIKDYGARTGADTVVEGAIPAGSETKWFTMDHPAFRTWRPRYEKDASGNYVLDGNSLKIMKDAEGNAIFEQVPLYIHGDFEGPLRAVLSQKSGALYGGMMSLKGKTMSMIMNSPMIHNAVEWGRALPAMPGKVATFKVYFEGNRAKNNPAIMGEAIDNGLMPIGHRFFNQDISGLMESPDLTPGRSWTAKLLAAVPGLFDEAAGVAVKRAIDKAGDFWHNTLLWDRVADLQMGLYVNLRADAIAKGIDPQTSSRLAAHWANRYAGALPKEAMSDAATKVANMLLFSRSFTLGNLGVMKDMLTGLPKDVIAQIERDAGFRSGAIDEAGSFSVAFRKPDGNIIKGKKGELHLGLAERSGVNVIEGEGALLEDGFIDKAGKFYSRQEMADKKLPESGEDLRNVMTAKDAVQHSKSLARRKAMAVVVADMALLYIGNSLMQNVFNVLTNDSTLDKELHGYAQRFKEKLSAVREHPLELIQPMKLLGDLGATSENEPGKQERIHVGQASNGTAIYMRQPAGKIGEEFAGYMTGPLDMMRKKLGTVARPAWQIMSNDAGFGRKVYDPDADTPGKYLKNLGLIAAHLAKSQFPEGQIGAFSDLVKGEGDAKVNAMQAFGPFAGVTFSKGAPGGPAVGEMYASRAQHEFAVNQALPDIRRQIQRGDIEGAMTRMGELNIPPGLQRFYVKTTLDPALRLSPRATRDFYLHSTPEQRARFERALTAPPPP